MLFERRYVLEPLPVFRLLHPVRASFGSREELAESRLVVSARRDHGGEVLLGWVFQAGEVAVEKELELVGLDVVGVQGDSIDRGVVDRHQRRSGRGQRVQSALHHSIDLGMVRLGAEQRFDHAKARTLQRVGLEERSVARRGLGVLGQRVVGIASRHHLKKCCNIGDGACERPDSVLRRRHRHDPVHADETFGWSQPDQIVRGRRRANGIHRVTACPREREVGRNGGPRSAARPSRCQRQIVRIEDLAADGADGDAPEREFLHIGLREDDRAGLAQFGGDESIPRGPVLGKRGGAPRGRQFRRVIVVLQDQRHARQRCVGSRSALCVVGVRLLESGRIDRADRAELRTVLVVGGDPIEIGLDNAVTGDTLGLKGSVKIRDRRFHLVEAVLRAKRRCDHDRAQGNTHAQQTSQHFRLHHSFRSFPFGNIMVRADQPVNECCRRGRAT